MVIVTEMWMCTTPKSIDYPIKKVPVILLFY